MPHRPGMRPLEEQVREALDAGITMLQLREKYLSEEDFLREALSIRKLTERYHVPLIIQPQRRAGKTHNNFYRLYDAAMLSVTSYTKVGLRLATIFGSICAAISMIVAIVYLVMKLLHWYDFPAGMAPVLIGMCFLGSVQIFFIGLVGEYILSINSRVMKRPLVVEEERLNFDTPVKKVGGKQHEM